MTSKANTIQTPATEHAVPRSPQAPVRDLVPVPNEDDVNPAVDPYGPMVI